LYLKGCYWGIATLTTVGFGDIQGGTASEKLICIVWMMLGVAFYSFTVGSIASILSSMDFKKKSSKKD
jgi:hyperpolarization activated cyclic nucleotide-gated potassium channel 2